MDTTQSPPVPIPLKLGDVNQDGFPDLLAIVVKGTGAQRTRTPYLILSVPCAKGIAGCDNHGNGRRGWQVVKKDADPLYAVEDARSVAFLDMDEDVRAPVLLGMLCSSVDGTLGHAGHHGPENGRPGTRQCHLRPE